MKKIIAILAIVLLPMTFISCSKSVEDVEKSKKSYTIKYECEYCGSARLKVFYPPSGQSDLPPSYTCRECGKGGVLRKVYN